MIFVQTYTLIIIIIIIISNYIKVRPKASGAGLVCRSHMSVQLSIVDTFVLGVTSINPIAIVNRFYLNLVVCLQLDIALLVQNYVKI